MLQGKVNFSLGKSVYVGKVGDLFLYDVGEMHDKSMPPEAPDSVTLIFQVYKDFTYAYVTQCLDGRHGISNRILFADAGTTPLLNLSWDRIRAAKGAERMSTCTQFFAMLDFMMAEIARRPSLEATEIATFDGSGTKPSAALIAGLVMAHIDEHKGQQSSLHEIMSISGYSASHINRIFQNNLGCTITEHANAWRLNRLYDMVQEGVPLKEIAFRLGFSTPAALSRWKRKQGI